VRDADELGSIGHLPNGLGEPIEVRFVERCIDLVE
jgi:hypothetical protein